LEKGRLSKKVILGLMLILSITSALVSALRIQPTKASGAIYIRADGTVDPSTAPIEPNGDVYTLLKDIFNMSIIVQRDYIVLDGNGHMLQMFQTSDYGIDLSVRINVTITRMVISGFDCGVWLDSSLYNSIINNTVVGSASDGITLYESDHNYLADNRIMNTNQAISLTLSNYNVLTGNSVLDNLNGISLYRGTSNTLRNNVMRGNRYGFYVGLFYPSSYINDVDTSNLMNGKPIYYWISHHNETVPADAGCAVIVDSSDITVKNLLLRNNVYGVTFAFTTESLIENITAADNEVAIELDHSDFNVITGNNVTASMSAGIGLMLSDYNEVSYNTVTNTSGSAIWLEDTSGNRVIGNSVANTTQGYGTQEFNAAGILVDDSPWSTLTDNNLVHNVYGIVLGAQASSFNLIVRNNIMMSQIGLVLFEGTSNTIYHNNFTQSEFRHVATYWGTKNTLDNRYPSGGNYWSDYNGTDENRDGIGDSPYVIDENNRDNYPLMKPYIGLHDVGITSANISKTVVGEGLSFQLNIIVSNHGDYSETLNITTYANTTEIATFSSRTLLGGASVTINYLFSHQPSKGHYTISACVWPVPGEKHTSDNNLTGGWIIVAIVGDITGPSGYPDGQCDARDVSKMCTLYGIRHPDPTYEANWDITGPTFGLADGKVDARDLALVCSRYGVKDPQ
jgi:parallel beta-helix repeat protein